MRKRIFFATSALLLLLACGSKKPAQDPSTTTAPPADPTDPAPAPTQSTTYSDSDKVMAKTGSPNLNLRVSRSVR
jgi:flagellar basal body L-ring protein FlgH